jgi:hypothetical protein
MTKQMIQPKAARVILMISAILWVVFLHPPQTAAEPETDAAADIPTLQFDNAVICEDVKDSNPIYPAVVFSIRLGKIFCYSLFEVVPKKTYIFHSWFHREKLVATKRIKLLPPRFVACSSIQLRRADKGPWSVEVSDDKGNVFKTLRFSITD